MTDATPERREITINVDAVKHIGMVGVTRAAGFLGLAFRRPDEQPPTDVTLPAFTQFHFLPNPLPEDLARDLVSEFNTWLVGNALQELDRHFSLFIDEVWRLIDITDHHARPVASNHVFADISKDTNAANKYAKVCESLEIKDPGTHMLWSLSNARNCLAHSAGRVQSRHLNDNGRMKLVWFGMDFTLTINDFTMIMDGVIDTRDLPEGDKIAAVQMLERERDFGLGEPVVLSPRDLHEICLTYARAIDKVMDGLRQRFEQRGILHTAPTADTSDS